MAFVNVTDFLIVMVLHHNLVSFPLSIPLFFIYKINYLCLCFFGIGSSGLNFDFPNIRFKLSH